MSTTATPSTLEQQRAAFARRRLIATPLAGMIAWAAVGLGGLLLSDTLTVWVLFIATGSIAYLGIFLSRFTGEHFLDKSRPPNTFDRLFFLTVGQSVLVYAIAIPFFLQDYTSLPLTVGILTGTMWLPMSWIIHHWVGLFHGLTRTVLVVLLWYLLPEWRFVAIPFAIVAVYAVTIYVLEQRYRRQPLYASRELER